MQVSRVSSVANSSHALYSRHLRIKTLHEKLNEREYFVTAFGYGLGTRTHTVLSVFKGTEEETIVYFKEWGGRKFSGA